jgi:hypothetical protein
LISDADMENLNTYLASTCYNLINVSKDYFYKELHQPSNQATLRTFALDKKLRTLVVARLDKPVVAGEGTATLLPPEEVKEETTLGGKEDEEVEILFTVKV